MNTFLANFVDLLFSVLYFAILVRILLSWIPMSQDNALIRLLNQITDPILAPARRLIPPMGGVDFSDAIVEYDEEADRYIAYLNDTRLPNLQINKEYALLARDKAAPKQDREFLKKNLSNAQWLIDAVNQRKHTLLRVISVVVEAQRDFFDYGP